MFINLSQRDVLLASYKAGQGKSNTPAQIERDERCYYTALAILWQALGLALALKIYLNSPHAVSHSEKELFSTAVELLCLFICLFALNMSVSQFKKKKKNRAKNRAFPSGSGNLAEGPNIGHEHANLISITECFHGHRNHTSQCLQKFKPRISKLTKIFVICPVLEMRNKIAQQLQ